jgi:glucan phosphoethanolaminetransferase (alkaline phosphatase superfamily)
LELVQLVVLVVVIVRGLLHLRDSRSSSFEKLAFVFAVLLLAVLSTSVWNNDPRAFRTMVDVFVLGSGVLLGSTSFRPLVLTALTWGVWLLAAAVSVRYI